MHTVSIQLSDADYERLNAMLSSRGMTLQKFFENYAKIAPRLGEVPYTDEYINDPFYTEENIKALRRSFRQVEEGKVVVKTMAELEAMAADE